MDSNYYYSDIPSEDLAILKAYLQQKTTLNNSVVFKVVMDILHKCDLNCIGCGTDASYIGKAGKRFCGQASLQDIEIAAEKIYEYALADEKSVYVNLGGGEPFLHEDILHIIDVLYKYFGKNGVGIDTNATLSNSYELIKKCADKLSYIGVSINGLHDYHNWWSGVREFDAFNRSIDTLKKLCTDHQLSSQIEVTSVATRNNLQELPILMEHLAEIGVKKYSVHRAIPVGRMRNRMDLIPDCKEYLYLLIELIKSSRKTGIDFHMHHSIENIHKSLLFGDKTYQDNKRGDKNLASSIGVNPEGYVVFDAWCMSDRLSYINCGNLFKDDADLFSMIRRTDTLFHKACEASNSENRCAGCENLCSGGSRIVAATTDLMKHSLNFERLSSNDFIAAFDAIDPACPRYDNN